MNINFRLGPVRVEVSPKPRLVLDVRRVIASDKPKRQSKPILLGSIVPHAGNGWLFSAPNGGWEYPAFLAAAALAVFLQGGGKYAVRD